MTEIDTLIAVSGTLLGTLLGTILAYFLNERAERRRVGREIALRPLEDKQAAMRDFYAHVSDIMTRMVRCLERKTPGGTPLQGRIDDFQTSFTRALLWFPNESRTKLIDAMGEIDELTRKIVSLGSISDLEESKLFDAFGIISKELEVQLGVKIAGDLEQVARTLGRKSL